MTSVLFLATKIFERASLWIIREHLNSWTPQTNPGKRGGKTSSEMMFIPAKCGYVVVVHIEKGIFKPYMTVENQTVFRFFVRHGNRKNAMSYSEIR